MKKIIHGLLALSTVASSGLFADVANKTFMAERGALSNNCLMSMSAGAMKNCKKDAIGADLSVTGFFRQSHNKTKLAKYFGGGTDAVPAGNIEVALSGAATTALNGPDIDVQATGDIASTMRGIVALSPRRTEVGAHVQWNQNLDKFVNGLWFSVAAPVTYVRTEMRADYTGATANATGTTAKGNGKTLSDYFTGADLGKTISTYIVQSALTNQKLTSTYNSTTGVADVKAVLGYNFVQEKDYSFGASIHGTIPTGNKPAGVVAFEPTYGHRSFFLGAGLNGEFNLWRSEDGKSELNMHACGKYSYGFSAEQVRTLGIANVTTGVLPMSQYVLLGKDATAYAVPTANVSTLAVTVEPRSRLEAVAGFCYRFNRFTIDAAYNLFYAQEEKVKLKGTWNEAQYGISKRTGITLTSTSYTYSDTAEITGGYILAPTSTIVTNQLSLAPATTPAQVVHKVGAGLGYSFDLSVPVRVGVGGDFDFSSNDQSINSWAAWAKVGFCF